MKRPASMKAGRAKKSRNTDAVAVDTIVKALVTEGGLSAGQCKLFGSMLPHALNSYKADRAPIENELMEKAEKALLATAKGMEADLAKAVATQEEVIAPAERKAREAVKAKAMKDLEEAVQALANANTARDDARKAVADSKTQQKATSESLSKVKAEIQVTTSDKEALSSALAVDFEMLKTEGCTTPDGKKALKRILMIGRKHDLDNSLFSALPNACQTAVAARTEFETMMFTNIQTTIEKALEDMAAKLKELATGETNAQEAFVKAEEGVTAAKDGLVAAEDALSKAADAVDSLKPAVKAAVAFLKSIWSDMKTACDDADDYATSVAEFKETIALFQKLKEKEFVPEPDPVPEPVAPAEVVAEPATQPAPPATA